MVIEMVRKIRKQITVKMDQAVWDEFKSFVKFTEGAFKGKAGEKLEEAITKYMSEDEDWVAEHYSNHHEPDTFDHDSEKETHTNQQHEDSSYAAIYADLHGRKQIHRNEFEGILTRRLGLKTDKSRRDHLKTFEHLGILEPHPVAGHKILTVNQDHLDFMP
jgi:hypothetical protein